MRTIAILNQKGGVGKTTTAVNLSAALAEAGQQVLLIDLDPQAHASLHLGLTLEPEEASLYDVLVGQTPLAEVCRAVNDHLTVAPAHLNLAAVEVELAGQPNRDAILRRQLTAIQHAFDYVVLDCPPSLGILTLNALSAVDEVFIPLQPHFLALHGLSKLLETIALVARQLNPQLKLSGVVLCMYEAATRLAAEVTGDLDRFFEQAAQGPSSPWSQARRFATRIRRNIRLAEAPSYGQSIFDYAGDSHGADDYLALAREVLAMEAALTGAAPAA